MTLREEIKQKLAVIETCIDGDIYTGKHPLADIAADLRAILDRHPETWSAEVPTEPGWYPMFLPWWPAGSRDDGSKSPGDNPRISRMCRRDDGMMCIDGQLPIGPGYAIFGPRVEFPPLPDKE